MLNNYFKESWGIYFCHYLKIKLIKKIYIQIG